MDCITVERLYKSYARGRTDVSVLKGVSLSIERGEMVAVMGASGSGKTTLINLLGCLDRPDSGRYWLDGIEISHLSDHDRALLRNRRIGFVFQNFNLLPRLTALENVMMPLTYSGTTMSEAECRDRARELLERVGLGDRVDHEPARLSGGEQQRVAIARAIAKRPDLLLCDEPTGALDSATGVQVLQALVAVNQAVGSTTLVITHNAAIKDIADRVVRFANGQMVDDQRIENRRDPAEVQW